MAGSNWPPVESSREEFQWGVPVGSSSGDPQWGIPACSPSGETPLGKPSVEPERGAPLGNPSVEPQRGVPVGSPSGEVQWGAPVRSPSGEPMGTPMGKQPSAAPQWGDSGALHRSSTLGFLWSLQLAAMAPRGSLQFPLDAQGSTLVPNESTGFPWWWEWGGDVGQVGFASFTNSSISAAPIFRISHFSHHPIFQNAEAGRLLWPVGLCRP